MSYHSDFFVKLFYRNDTTSDNIEALAIPWCGGATSCTWAQFVKYVLSVRNTVRMEVGYSYYTTMAVSLIHTPLADYFNVDCNGD